MEKRGGYVLMRGYSQGLVERRCSPLVVGIYTPYESPKGKMDSRKQEKTEGGSVAICTEYRSP